MKKFGPWRITTVAIVVITLVSVLLSSGSFDHLLIFTVRLPVFLLGAALGLSQLDKLKPQILFSLAGATLIGYLTLWYVTYYVDFSTRNETGLRWYPTTLLAIPVAIWMAYICSAIRTYIHPLYRFFNFIGTYTLEIYLTHLIVFMAGPEVFPNLGIVNSHRALEYLIYLIICIALSIALKKIIDTLYLFRKAF